MEKKMVSVSNVYNYDYLGFTNCVSYNGVIYITGQAGIDTQGNIVGEGIKEQSIKTFENIQTILQTAGASLADILAMTCFIVDIEKNGPVFFATRAQMMPVKSFTSASIGISQLAMPGLLVEVQCTAALSS
ncbi:Rid family hydrolase [Legionella brunensis]|uniref:L-PSP (MRNA) endoribonuclease n=1 Tax=Legionella brunensis TaxID=29422 RepID=A0A0W0S0Q9_9GAMM|nr:Rid family hydrolase [Legionella brunensis]KTC76888.1 L-PSP (mRNA) endoribonuclease [Legionella brunensis]